MHEELPEIVFCFGVNLAIHCDIQRLVNWCHEEARDWEHRMPVCGCNKEREKEEIERGWRKICMAHSSRITNEKRPGPQCQYSITWTLWYNQGNLHTINAFSFWYQYFLVSLSWVNSMLVDCFCYFKVSRLWQLSFPVSVKKSHVGCIVCII